MDRQLQFILILSSGDQPVTRKKDDWMQQPRVFQIARQPMNGVKINFGVTNLYHPVGLTLTASDILPPILAAAAQSLPGLGILGNSSRLLRQK